MNSEQTPKLTINIVINSAEMSCELSVPFNWRKSGGKINNESRMEDQKDERCRNDMHNNASMNDVARSLLFSFVFLLNWMTKGWPRSTSRELSSSTSIIGSFKGGFRWQW